MSPIVVYVLLLKAIATSFAGMGSLPQIQQDFVETRHALTVEQTNQAVLVGRSTPGPIGAYVVSVGYLAAGWPGAVAAWLAMITPALAAVPLVLLMQRWLYLPRVRAVVEGVVIGSAILILSSGVRMAVDAWQQLVSVQ
mgnify:FL=1